MHSLFMDDLFKYEIFFFFFFVTSKILKSLFFLFSGKFVFGVSAIDSDIGPNGKLLYSLSGPDKSKFLINSTTGVVKANQNLYRTTGSKFTVYITASDQVS